MEGSLIFRRGVVAEGLGTRLDEVSTISVFHINFFPHRPNIEYKIKPFFNDT